MARLSVSLRQLEAMTPPDGELAAFSRAIRRAGVDPQNVSAADAAEAGAGLHHFAFVLDRLTISQPALRRAVRYWMSDCAAHTLPIFEDARPHDKRVRQAIVACRKLAEGQLSAAQRSNAKREAEQAGRDCDRRAARAAAHCAAHALAGTVSLKHAIDQCGLDASMARTAFQTDPTEGVGPSPYGDGTRWFLNLLTDAEGGWQLERLLAWLSENEPAPWPLDAPRQFAR